MKKNGFTLIELLAVLAILAILALLITPTVFNSIEKFKNDSNDKQISMIESAASNWASDRLTQFVPGTYYITIGDLKAEGYLEKNLKDLNTNKNFPNDANIKIQYTGKNYKVNYIKNSGTSSIESNLDNNGPRIKLTGNSIITHKIGDTFTDQGVIAYSSSGSNITSSVTKTIKKDNSSVVSSINTSTDGNYVIYYKVVSNGVTQVVTRNVIVQISNLTVTINNVNGSVPRADFSTMMYDSPNPEGPDDNGPEDLSKNFECNVTISYINMPSTDSVFLNLDFYYKYSNQNSWTTLGNYKNSISIFPAGLIISLRVNEVPTSNYYFKVVATDSLSNQTEKIVYI